MKITQSLTIGSAAILALVIIVRPGSYGAVEPADSLFELGFPLTTTFDS